MNEIYWFITIFANFGLILLAYWLFGRNGLFIWISIASIIANVEVVQTLELFGLAATLGNVVYATTFLVTDILSEKYGRKEANRAVWIGFFSLISMTLLMNLSLLFQPMDDEYSRNAHESLSLIFGVMPRIVLASLTAYFISQRHDVWAFHFWMRLFPGRGKLWIRNNLSTMVSQLIDSLIFTFIAFYGVFEWPVLMEILLTTYLLKWIVAAMDTPFVYLATKIKPRVVSAE
ncbi:MAG TPA: queuosine precursor transporter [Bacteroidales bacterium]|nr:queuosine precursor transporter [Bacteroidales bacterium]